MQELSLQEVFINPQMDIPTFEESIKQQINKKYQKDKNQIILKKNFNETKRK